MKEHYYDKLLNIKTRGDQKSFNKSFHYHPYEPTPYHALETLFQQYKIKSTDRIVDFGCGKGRLNFFVHYLYDVSATGIEMNEAFYHESVENRNRYFSKNKKGKGTIQFRCCLAEEYEIDKMDNRFYFFNPFSVQIFMNVINNILLSVETASREIELILYYSSDEYIYFLETNTSFVLKKEVLLPGFYEKNPYERFLIYSLNY
ncbi:methyltransferase [Bacillus sp. Marseille-P3661]|uniref:methyltransferase n=1 Tax=Bacillus sp. Marseille-P3661 TaxID=1936234 RepID=UPI000C826804|nr:methyltransferase [Bacillus sp. Marseille-P3661]